MTDSTTRSKALRPLVVGVSGGSGSGKTYFAQALIKAIGSENCDVIYQDHFYKDQSAKFDFDGGSVNFDHPEALDFDLFAHCLKELKSGRSVAIPQYDFKTHSRQGLGNRMTPKQVLIADGTLIFHYNWVRSLFDYMVFIETPEDLRFSRRRQRDVRERGRTPEGVHAQFYTQVKPMHDEFVAPSSQFAQNVIRDGEEFDQALKTCLELVKGKV